MSSGGDQRAWRGSRPASITKAPQSQSQSQSNSRSVTASPNISGTSKPASQTPRSDPAKVTNGDRTQSQETQQQKPVAPSPVAPAQTQGNFWEQRKAAQKPKPTAQGSNDASKQVKPETASQGGRDSTKTSEGGPKSTTNKGPAQTNAKSATSSGRDHVSVNGFNSVQAKDMLRAGMSEVKTYRMTDDGHKSDTSSSSSAQSLLTQMKKEMLELQNKQ